MLLTYLNNTCNLFEKKISSIYLHVKKNMILSINLNKIKFDSIELKLFVFLEFRTLF